MSSKDKGRNGRPAAMEPAPVLRVLGWTIFCGLWLLLAAALVSYDPADPPGHTVAPLNEQPTNWVGQFGAVVAHHTYLMLGPGVWVGMTGVAAFLVLTFKGRAVSQPVLRLIGVALMSVAGSSLVAVGAMRAGDGSLTGAVAGLLPGVDRPEGAGGLIAVWVTSELAPRFNIVGTFVIVTVGFWVGAILAADQVVLALPKLLGRVLLKLKEVRIPRPRIGRMMPRLAGAFGAGGDASGNGTATAERPRKRWGRGKKTTDDADGADGDVDHIPEDAGGVGGTESFDPDSLSPNGSKRKGRKVMERASSQAIEDEWDDEYSEDPDAEWEYQYVDEDGNPIDASQLDEYEVYDAGDDAEHADDEAPGDDEGGAPASYMEDKQEFTQEELREKMKKLTINFAPQAKKTVPPPREVDLSGYRFPGLDILVEAESNFTEEQEKIVREQAVLLESALREYRIEGGVVGIDTGPVITLYEVRLAPGTKVSRISTVSSDIARALKAHNIRIVPNTAGKDTVGVEVPNLNKERVRLKELMTVEDERSRSAKLPMFLGKDASGNPVIEDLTKMPHMLIAGTTGSGKSVCMNSIIMSFLYTKRPDELKMVLVDPKMVEMSLFKDVPHLMCPVVTEMSKAAAILEWAVTKMDERYELLAEAGVRDIAGYNALTWDEIKERFLPSNEDEEAKIPKKLPYMVFIIDELADMMMTNKEVEHFIVRIAQKARAVGMHLILATQRPQANVVTGLIKSNMPCRVAFKVASGMDSRIVLDQKGAELLLGQGDMLYLTPRSSKLVRAQGTLVDDIEIRRTVKFLKEITAQSFEPQLVQLKGPGAASEEDMERDPLFDDAVAIVLETKRGSVSLLQRRLAIGYSRSSRLIEQMSMAGIIGEYKGSQAREVNVTLEEWEAMRAAAEAEANVVEVNGTLPEEGEEDGEEALEEDDVVDEFDDGDEDFDEEGEEA